MKTAKEYFKFDNTYIKLPGKFYQRIKPEPVKNPTLIKLNLQLSNYLNLEISSLKNNSGISILSGNQVPKNTTPIAMVYAGHQFGNFVNQLGDGRAVLIGEIIAKDGKRYDLQLKGSGKTMYSRQGDGRAPLGPVIREYIISEAMYHLGIPTTRALSIISTGEFVEREKIEPGGVLARISSSHIRIGTFEFFSARKDFNALKKIADYTIRRHYPEILSKNKNNYSLLLEKVILSQAKLISQWMNFGFIHGVMNTDNTSISGETIDYGPCAFINNYDPMTVYSYIDFQGRYSFGNQPKIMLWNLSKFAESISSLIDEDPNLANQKIINSLKKFPELFSKFWIKGIKKKIGLSSTFQNDTKLIESLLEMMYKEEADFTLTFRKLAESLKNEQKKNDFFSLFNNKEHFLDWYQKWNLRIKKEKESKDILLKKMNAVNPLFIPRNHLVEKAINETVEKNNLSMLDDLLEVLKNPFTEKKKKSKFSRPPDNSEDIKNTFCGT